MVKARVQIEDLFPPGVTLNVPPRIQNHRQKTATQFFQTQGIALARIVVEMKIKQLKNYRTLNGTLPIE